MSIKSTLATCFILCSVFAFSGCVGPNAHGPLGGCTGPLVVSNCKDCSGCGELYVDPWVNHPADCVDPCDSCGNYNGQSCGSCRPMFEGIRNLWGYRVGDCGGACDAPACEVSCGCGALSGCGAEVCEPGCGCDSVGSCSDGACSSCHGSDVIHGEGEIIYEGDHIESVPMGTPGTHATPEVIQPAESRVERKRKIFNPKPRVATGSGRSIGY